MAHPTAPSSGRRPRGRSFVVHLLVFVVANAVAATWDGSWLVGLATGEIPGGSAFSNFSGADLPRISLYATRVWTLLLVLDGIWTLVSGSRKQRP